MCGLFGIISTTALGLDEEKFIKQCTFTGTLRGRDSTGLALIDKENNVNLYKRALSGPDFANSDVGSRCFNQLDKSFIVIGHNRAATIGAVNDRTAHPFIFGNMVGAHNGTLQYHKTLPVSEHSIDSMNLLASLADTDGTSKELIRVLEQVQGSYAVTLYDTDTEIMWFVRNDERPLHWAPTDDGAVVWASEAGMLSWVAARCGIKLDKIHGLTENTLYGLDCREMKPVAEEKYEPPKPEPYSHGGYGNRGYWDNYGNTGSYSHNNKYKYHSVDEAIKHKIWNKDDTILNVVFTSVENPTKAKNSSILQHHGIGFNDSGEAFEVSAWISTGHVKLNALYLAEVRTIVTKSDSYSDIIKLNLDSKELEIITADRTEAETEIIGMVDDTTMWHGNSFSHLLPFRDTDKSNNKKIAKLEDKRKKGNSKSNKDKDDGTVQGPFECRLSLRDYKELTEKGCYHCHCDISVDDAPTLGWLNSKHPICQDCIELVEECMRDSNDQMYS